jgi:hypothetical protein
VYKGAHPGDQNGNPRQKECAAYSAVFVLSFVAPQARSAHFRFSLMQAPRHPLPRQRATYEGIAKNKAQDSIPLTMDIAISDGKPSGAIMTPTRNLFHHRYKKLFARSLTKPSDRNRYLPRWHYPSTSFKPLMAVNNLWASDSLDFVRRC